MKDDRYICEYEEDDDGTIKEFEISLDFVNVIALKICDSEKYKFITYT